MSWDHSETTKSTWFSVNSKPIIHKALKLLVIVACTVQLGHHIESMKYPLNGYLEKSWSDSIPLVPGVMVYGTFLSV
jgi:hypothetical protein